MAKKRKSLEFPASDAKFDVAFTNLMNHLASPDTSSSLPTTNSYVRLALNTTTQYNPLLAILGTPTTVNTWLYVYQLEKHKATHNATLKTQKNTLKKKALAIIRPLRISLKALEKTTSGTLTAADKQYLFIPEPNPRTSTIETLRTTHPVPVLSIESIQHLLHMVDLRDPASPKSTSFPDGIVLMQLKRFIGTVAPADITSYTDLLFSGKFRNSSHFVAANEGQKAWYIGRYISATGEVSDWSAPVSATIA